MFSVENVLIKFLLTSSTKYVIEPVVPKLVHTTVYMYAFYNDFNISAVKGLFSSEQLIFAYKPQIDNR